MLYRKQGIPEEEELVLCTVTNVQSHSVFAKLDEYDKSGMIHISEVAPGRIRNIRDFVIEGKKVICKVLRIDPIKGHIDLSLRRVNASQKRKKNEEIKQEMKAEKLIEDLAKKSGKDVKVLYDEISSKVFEKYEYLHQAFNDIVIAQKYDLLEKLGIEKKLAADVTALVKERIRPPEAIVKAELSIVSWDKDGVNIVKEALAKAEAIAKEGVSITYKGAGIYNVVVKSDNYKDAEKILEKVTSAAIKQIEKSGGEGSFKKIEIKD